MHITGVFKKSKEMFMVKTMHGFQNVSQENKQLPISFFHEPLEGSPQRGAGVGVFDKRTRTLDTLVGQLSIAFM